MKHLILLKIPPHGKVPMGGFEKCCLLQQVLKSSVLSSDSFCSEYPCCFPTVQLLGWCLCPKSWVSMFLARLTSLDYFAPTELYTYSGFWQHFSFSYTFLTSLVLLIQIMSTTNSTSFGSVFQFFCDNTSMWSTKTLRWINSSILI